MSTFVTLLEEEGKRVLPIVTVLMGGVNNCDEEESVSTIVTLLEEERERSLTIVTVTPLEKEEERVSRTVTP